MKRPGTYWWRTRAGSRWRAGGFLLLAGGLFALGAALGWSPVGLLAPCAFQRMTGWRCPACGGTRMLAALLRGDVALAWYYHPALLLAMAAVVVGAVWAFVRTFRKEWRPLSLHVRSRWWLAVPAAVVLFEILRNLPLYQRWFY